MLREGTRGGVQETLTARVEAGWENLRFGSRVERLRTCVRLDGIGRAYRPRDEPDEVEGTSVGSTPLFDINHFLMRAAHSTCTAAEPG